MSDIASIKQKSIIAYLSSQGIEPKKNGVKTATYLCPWSGEKTPSMAVYKETNTWNNFGGGGGGGSIIELVQKLHNVDFVGALRLLENGNVSCVTQSSVIPRKDDPPPIKIISIGEITSDFLIRYLQKRCISLEVARKYCKQLRVELNGDKGPYRKTMIGFSNAKGGWSLRNKFSKLAVSPNFYAEINPGKEKCISFEGFFNYLTMIELYGFRNDYTYLILNSAVNRAYVDWKKYPTVVYCGDNDKAGQDVLDDIAKATKVNDIRHLYLPKNDINAWFVDMMEFKNTFLNKRLL